MRQVSAVLRERLILLLAIALGLPVAGGCHLLLPQTAHEPVIRNPFPQLSRAAVAPFFNHSDEPTVDGRQFALAYFAALQSTPGFEVVPLGLVEETMMAHRIDLSEPGEARRLAELLGVDAVVVGSITDYSPYYPPRVGLRVEWYAANPGFHEIPAGYGLPWGTPEEEFIPDELAYASQLSLARAQLASQSPDCSGSSQTLPAPPASANLPTDAASGLLPDFAATGNAREEFDPFSAATAGVQAASFNEQPLAPGPIGPFGISDTAATGLAGEDCFCPQYAAGVRPPCVIHHGPVLSHTQIYNSLDHDVTQALQGYAFFQDDERTSGWQSILRRSDDYIRFCCHLHIAEMLSARGGGHKTRLVWRWPDNR